MRRLTNPDDIEDARRRVAELLDARGEWFWTTKTGGNSFALRRGEWELRAAHGALFFSLPTETGVRVWRVSGWDWTGAKLCLEVTRRARGEHAKLELVPRASAQAAGVLARAARQAACERLAALVAGTLGAQIETARLSAGARRNEPGRFARIMLRKSHVCTAVAAPVVELGVGASDAFLASSLMWFARLGERRRAKPPERLCLVATRALCRATVERMALLRDEWARALVVYELDDAWEKLERVCVPALEELLSATPRFRRPAKFDVSEQAACIMSLAPDAIDVVRARHGETLRFHGLAFARVRRVMNREHAWFGIGAGRAQRQLLDGSNLTELTALVGELAAHRTAHAGNRQHALYRAAPEAWLESLLRRDITRLDPGMRLAPLHAQFRTSREAHAGARPVDLLALRRDGRLVVIELKVSEDAALALQGADYWRRISTYHRAGHIARARLFGDAEISPEPPLVYLVAPLLRFHRDFNMISHAVKPEIEMYRFDLNEDWRAGVRVARRARVN